ncbi:MAG TPA: histidine phosphotransferase family protein [Caulobacteraceae bacterium]
MDDDAEIPSLPGPAELGALMCARLCHDFISPASAITSGIDLLEDPSAQDMHDDALGLITQSSRKLVDQLAFARVAFGASAAAESFDARDLETLAKGVFAHVRPDLDWDVTPPALNKAAARTILNLAQIAAGALPMGGTARVKVTEADGRVDMVIEAEGRARLRPEVLAGLRGDPLPEGALGGQWVQAYYLSLVLTQAGGEVSADTGEEHVRLSAWVPA